MKKLVAGVLAVLSLLSIALVAVPAAPVSAATTAGGPYDGSFRGFVYGDRSSKAPMALDLTQRGSQVEGDVVLGEGLYVDGGMCGAVNVPAAAQQIEGQTMPGNPKRLVATPAFDAGGFELRVNLESNVSADGKTLSAKAKFDLPWFCGRDPVLTATLYRD